MHRASKLAIIGLVLSVSITPPAFAEDARLIAVGAGHGPQWSDNPVQHNSVIDVNFFFKAYPVPKLGRSTFLLGLGYSYLWTDVDVDRDNHVISLLLAYRYYFELSEKIEMFVHLAGGPSVMSDYNLGYREQGSKFIFNDYAGVGVRFGESNKWELSLVWRHLSNARLAKPNDGFDVPFTVILGRAF